MCPQHYSTLPRIFHGVLLCRRYEPRRADDEGKVVLDLGDTVSRMKSEYGVAQVLTWHAMTGYWAGVEPEADEIRPFQPFVAKLLAPEGIRKVDPEVRRSRQKMRAQ